MVDYPTCCKQVGETKILLKNKGLASYVPSTRQYSLEALGDMLGTHTLVYIKPDRGPMASASCQSSGSIQNR